MILYRTLRGPMVEEAGRWFAVPASAGNWDELLNRDDLPAFLAGVVAQAAPLPAGPAADELLAPLGQQEVWGAGVTYLRSMKARVEESHAAGASDFYDRVYRAPRPEIFFKATPHRVVGPGGRLRLRRDSHWIVPEPELTLAITRGGAVVGYTIGNDLSCRDIEAQNPLYLPQAKTFDRCAAVGPGILVTADPLPGSTGIGLTIHRDGAVVYAGQTQWDRMQRPLKELVDYLFRENCFPQGCLLMTGTGIVPPDGFCLRAGDRIDITIDGIGTLTNIAGG